MGALKVSLTPVSYSQQPKIALNRTLIIFLFKSSPILKARRSPAYLDIAYKVRGSSRVPNSSKSSFQPVSPNPPLPYAEPELILIILFTEGDRPADLRIFISPLRFTSKMDNGFEISRSTPAVIAAP